MNWRNVMKWLPHKRRNRRVGGVTMLDVKIITEKVAAARWRKAGLVLGGAMAVVLVLGLLWAGCSWMVHRFIYRNPAFAIREIRVETDGVLLRDVIQRWSLVKPGDNLMALDLARVKRDLELVPLIRCASVERVLPHTLRLRVNEREPVAQVYVMQMQSPGVYQQSLYHLDEDGVVMLPLDPRQRSTPLPGTNAHLPVISGLPACELRPGRAVESPQVRAALDLLTALEVSPMAGLADLMRVDVAVPGVLRAYTSHGSEVTFAPENIGLQLRRWRAVHDYYLRTGKAIAALDLSVANNVPVRCVDVTAAPRPVTGRTILKPSRPTRKKHV